MKFFTRQAENKDDRPITGLTMLEVFTDRKTIRCYYSNGTLFIIIHRIAPYRSTIYRLASDKSSALILRRQKELLGLLKPDQISMSEAELHMRLSELIAQAMSDNIDSLLTGEAK